MTALTAVTSQLALPLDDDLPDEAELAAAAFLARYQGRTLEVTPNSSVAQDTECRWRPIAHTPARRVIVERAEAMLGRSSVQVPSLQSASPQDCDDGDDELQPDDHTFD